MGELRAGETRNAGSGPGSKGRIELGLGRAPAQAQAHVRARRIDALVHETAQAPLTSADTLRAYRAAGYQVEIVTLGVPAAMSNQDILHRYHGLVQDRGAGRLTVQANADEDDVVPQRW